MSDQPEKPKKEPRVGVPVRFSPSSLPAIDRTAKALGHKNRSEYIRAVVFADVQKNDPDRKKPR